MESIWLERIERIRSWNRGGVRAPHKPLLLLYAIAHLQKTGSPQIVFSEVADDLEELLRQYGPPRHSYHPELPFFHLANDDDIWELKTDSASLPNQPSKQQLKAAHAVGQLSPTLTASIQKDPSLAAAIATYLLNENFPSTMQDDLVTHLGLSLESLINGHLMTTTPRDSKFRESVLVAYEYQCAFCGYDGRLGHEAVGLDAAHVRWHAGGGSDVVANGLCLCSFHHKAFDRGVLAVSDEHTVLVSKGFVGSSDAAGFLVLKLSGRALKGPQPGDPPVAVHNLAWHRTEVFRGPARQLAKP